MDSDSANTWQTREDRERIGSQGQYSHEMDVVAMIDEFMLWYSSRHKISVNALVKLGVACSASNVLFAATIWFFMFNGDPVDERLLWIERGCFISSLSLALCEIILACYLIIRRQRFKKIEKIYIWVVCINLAIYIGMVFTPRIQS
jgi:hypothetical protein